MSGYLPLLLLLIGTSAAAASAADCTDYTPQRRAWFGDLHVHTALSLDARQQDTRAGPADAYRFARGELIGIPPLDSDGKELKFARIGRPLDFAAVTDHAELLGETAICNNSDMAGYWSFSCMGSRWLPTIFSTFINMQSSRGERMGFCGADGALCRQGARGPWRQIQQAARQANMPCRFSSFVAYEWTGASYPGGRLLANLHRNVIFSGEHVPELPSSALDSKDAYALYRHLEEQCTDAEPACDAVVIPHNSNISLAQMFRTDYPDGSPLTAAQARQRAHFETLAEIIQHKGASECYAGPRPMMPADELCDFEQLPWNSFVGNTLKSLAQPIQADAGFLRHALQRGLQREQQAGVNPFRFGFIGSTDTHRALAGGVDEYDFQGHGGAGNAAATEGAVGLPDQWEFNPGGLAVLYAEQNTRAALFAAMRRREAYATSGPRLQLRLFGGWEYPGDLCERADFVARGYAGGVPMGGTLRQPEQPDQAPRFAVSAQRAPGVLHRSGTPLQRIQIIKGWVTAAGESRQRVYEVAGDPDNGATADPADCRQSGSGFDSLCAVWEDPDFDLSQRAFYYTRVVENPACRWSGHLCAANGVQCDKPETIGEGFEDCCADNHRPTIQERAWSSPIWHSPGGS